MPFRTLQWISGVIAGEATAVSREATGPGNFPGQNGGSFKAWAVQ